MALPYQYPHSNGTEPLEYFAAMIPTYAALDWLGTTERRALYACYCPSGRAGPVSLSYQNGLLYVLNAANASTEAANVAGFHVDAHGTLHPIAGATQPLSAAHPNPAQVQIDRDGDTVLVTEKGTNL